MQMMIAQGLYNQSIFFFETSGQALQLLEPVCLWVFVATDLCQGPQVRKAIFCIRDSIVSGGRFEPLFFCIFSKKFYLFTFTPCIFNKLVLQKEVCFMFLLAQEKSDTIEF